MPDRPMVVRVGSSKRITLPRVVRGRLGIKAGGHLVVDVQGGLLVPAPLFQDHATRLAGLHGAIWDDVDTDAYLHGEREA